MFNKSMLLFFLQTEGDVRRMFDLGIPPDIYEEYKSRGGTEEALYANRNVSDSDDDGEGTSVGQGIVDGLEGAGAEGESGVAEMLTAQKKELSLRTPQPVGKERAFRTPERIDRWFKRPRAEEARNQTNKEKHPHLPPWLTAKKTAVGCQVKKNGKGSGPISEGESGVGDADGVEEGTSGEDDDVMECRDASKAEVPSTSQGMLKTAGE